ncbi:hypothetical protein GCM10010211_45370 [Streptomyces albospinus]|uniref:Recombinase zinc beta ribbon domain-containing protein n=1 Tax=Streptomyces albospinus TaxID=285515 RepID=A0ABQ2V8M2_9ACTN|nr:hypothetical protein [Streptomyces albospinus]GGU74445.1 hypothetical protein GCM10010211_45370 [Streptomyces albospinus]
MRGRIRCFLCQRKMQGTFNHGHPHYRCRYPSEYAKSEGFDHPLAVYVREALILTELDKWIATVFAPGRLKATLHAMQQSQRAHVAAEPDLGAARQAIAECDRRLTQYQAALDAGANPTTVADWISQAEAEKAAAQHQLATARAAQRTVLTDEQITHMIKGLGDLTDRLLAADTGSKARIYEAFGLALTYNATKRAVTVESQPASSVHARTCPRGDLNPHAR